MVSADGPAKRREDNMADQTDSWIRTSLLPRPSRDEVRKAIVAGAEGDVVSVGYNVAFSFQSRGC